VWEVGRQDSMKFERDDENRSRALIAASRVGSLGIRRRRLAALEDDCWTILERVTLARKMIYRAIQKSDP
jgi:hypothetical protein